MNIRPVLRYNQLIIRAFSDVSKKEAKKATTSPPSLSVAGLSSKCVKPITAPVGPGASTTGNYKVPEYFCYDKTSFAEAEIEMARFRCPQPSARPTSDVAER